MPPMRCNVFHHSCNVAWACTKLCMMCMTVGIYMAVLYYHDIRMNISAFRVIHYILHFLAKFEPSLSKPLSCFLLGWSTPAATLLPRSRGKPVQLGVKICLTRLLWPK